MADASFPLELVTPTGGVQRMTCVSLVVTLCDGEIGILKGRAPMMAALPAGSIRVRTGETVERFEIGDAFLQVTAKGAAIFSDICKKTDG